MNAIDLSSYLVVLCVKGAERGWGLFPIVKCPWSCFLCTFSHWYKRAACWLSYDCFPISGFQASSLSSVFWFAYGLVERA